MDLECNSSLGLVYRAHPYGKVSVLSSYADFFKFDTDAGAPNLGMAPIFSENQTLHIPLGAGSCDDELSVDEW
jgi:hypothetical protein